MIRKLAKEHSVLYTSNQQQARSGKKNARVDMQQGLMCGWTLGLQAD